MFGHDKHKSFLDAMKIESAHCDGEIQAPGFDTTCTLDLELKASIGSLSFTYEVQSNYYGEIDDVEEMIEYIEDGEIKLEKFSSEIATELATEFAAFRFADRGKAPDPKELQKATNIYLSKLFPKEERFHGFLRRLVTLKLLRDHHHQLQKWRHACNKEHEQAEEEWRKASDSFM